MPGVSKIPRDLIDALTPYFCRREDGCGGLGLVLGHYTAQKYNGDAVGASVTINVVTDFSLPSGAEAIQARLGLQDSTVGTAAALSGTSGDLTDGISQVAQVTNRAINVCGMVPIVNDTMYLYVSAAVDLIWIDITGYYI